MLRFSIFFSVLILIIFSCSGLMQRKRISVKGIKELTLYNTISEDVNTDIKNLSHYKSKSFNDSATISLLENITRISGIYIWKGSIIGIIRYENGDSIKIRISRYGGFFKSFSDNKFYSFSDKATNYKFQDFVDAFIDETIK